MNKKPEKVRTDPRYGDIPLVRIDYKTQGGRDSCYWTYDLDWQPALPKGAVRGNPRKQNACFACNVPRYFYVDEARICVECDRPFTFWAKEQKYWYEDLGFYASSEAVRCVDCRKSRRREIGLQQAYGSAVKEAAAHPGDAGMQLALVDATLAYHQMARKGDLTRALAAARKIRRLDRTRLESHFWEGAVHAAAGRVEKAAECYAHFIESAQGEKRYKALLKKAARKPS